MAEFQPGKHHLLWSALAGGFIVYLTLLSRPAEAQLTAFQVVPLHFWYLLKTESSSSTRLSLRPFMQCTVRGKHFEHLNITRTLLDDKGNLNMSSKAVVMYMPGEWATTHREDKWRVEKPFRDNKTRYIPVGRLTLVAGNYDGFIKMTFDHLTCLDQAYFACELSHKILSRDKKAGTETLLYRKSGDYLRLNPFGLRLEWINPPSIDHPLENNTNVKVKCIGNVGILNVGGGPVQLVWSYIPHNKTYDAHPLEGREWAKALEYGPEKEIYNEDGQFCTMQQEVTLSFKIVDKRDSNRLYRCTVKRITSSRSVEYVRFWDENKQYIKVPDFYPPPKEKPIGTQGLLGAIAATIAFLFIAVFAGIWYVRVQAKKKARAEELNKRKADIDVRRRSIINIVEARRQAREEAS